MKVLCVQRIGFLKISFVANDSNVSNVPPIRAIWKGGGMETCLRFNCDDIHKRDTVSSSGDQKKILSELLKDRKTIV